MITKTASARAPRLALFSLLAASTLTAADPLELYRQGLRFVAQNQPGPAIAAFTQSLQIRPGDALVWQALGGVYASQGDFRAAEEPFQRACRINPALLDACREYAHSLYLQDRFEPALDVLVHAIQKDTANAPLYLLEAHCLEALGRTTGAQEAYRLATRFAGNSALNQDPGIDYGVFLFDHGRFEQALKPLQSAISRQPASPRAQTELGRVLLALNRLNDAAATLQRALALDPESAPAHLLLGQTYLKLGQPALAAPHLAKGEKSAK